MSIVFITIPGNDKREFANALHEQTGGAVQLVVIQQPKRTMPLESLRRLYRTVGIAKLPKEMWYAILLRVQPDVHRALGYFRKNSIASNAGTYTPPTLEVASVNSDEVHAQLQALSPNVLVVWGSTILERRILDTAKNVINLHLGYCPHYRGALANQHAVLNGERTRIGATVHYVNEKADAGDIIEVIPGDSSRSPESLFQELNDRARETLLEVATKLARGEDVPARGQSHREGQTLLLKDWIPSVRYAVGKRILEWQGEARGNAAR